MGTLWIGNDNVLEVSVRDVVAQEWEGDDCTVTATLKDSAGATVTGSAITLVYVEDSSGRFRGTFLSTLALTANRAYTAMVEVETPDGEIGHLEVRLTAKVRTG